MDQSLDIPSPDRVTGAQAAFAHLVAEKVQAFLAATGRNPEDRQALTDPASLALDRQLWRLYPEFQRRHAALFLEHVGADRSAAVLVELSQEPHQRYLRARVAMAPQLAAVLRQLGERLNASVGL